MLERFLETIVSKFLEHQVTFILAFNFFNSSDNAICFALISAFLAFICIRSFVAKTSATDTSFLSSQETVPHRIL